MLAHPLADLEAAFKPATNVLNNAARAAPPCANCSLRIAGHFWAVILQSLDNSSASLSLVQAVANASVHLHDSGSMVRLIAPTQGVFEGPTFA